MATDLAQLPGEQDMPDIAPQDVVLSFSETKEEARARTGKQAAGARLGYWRILRRTRERGGSAIYVLDQDLQADLMRLVGDDQPSYIPCAVVGNPIADPSRPGALTLPGSIMFRRYAWYGAHKPLCHCDQAEALNRTAQRAITEQVQINGKSAQKVVGYKPYPCAGEECPDHIAKRCKPQVVVSVRLPWAGGILAKFRTTGKVSFGAMRASLLDIADMAGGWLHGVPLQLCYDEELVGDYWVPQIRFRPARELGQRLLEEGQRLSQLYGSNVENAAQIRRLQEAAQTSIVRFVEDPGEQAAFQREFHPDQPEVLDATFEVEPEAAPADKKQAQRLDAKAAAAAAGKTLLPPEDVVDLATFKAAMMSAGVTTSAQMAKAKLAANMGDYLLDQLDVPALQTIYRVATGQGEEEKPDAG